MGDKLLNMVNSLEIELKNFFRMLVRVEVC